MLEYIYFFFGYFSKDTYTQARARKWMTAQNLLINTECFANQPNFIFE